MRAPVMAETKQGSPDFIQAGRRAIDHPLSGGKVDEVLVPGPAPEDLALAVE